MNSGFALLWSQILDSSIWMESKETRLVWITMLAMRDSEGKVICSIKALAHRARVEPEHAEEAIRCFLSPDPDSRTKIEGGRRVREIDGGWQLINHEQYRFSTEAKRAFWREQKQRQRELEKIEESARNKEYSKRKKIVKREGAIIGATQAINEGLDSLAGEHSGGSAPGLAFDHPLPDAEQSREVLKALAGKPKLNYQQGVKVEPPPKVNANYEGTNW